MIKILHLQTELNLACGVTRTISQIIKNSSPEFEHHLIALGGDGMNRFETFGFEPTISGFDRLSVGGTVKLFFFLLNYCKEHSIDIIHSHHRYFDTLSWFLKSLIKIKTVTSVQSKVYEHNVFSYKADKLIACSNTIKIHLINNFKKTKNKINVINNTVEPIFQNNINDKQRIKIKLKINSGDFVIGFVGRMDYKEKGIDILLKAFNEISKQISKMHLVLIGEGINFAEVKEYVTTTGQSITLLSSKENIYDYYDIMDLVVLPSRIEPFGIVVIESGTMSKPFIGSRVDGITEIIESEKDGLLFESGNVEELINQIIRVHDNREWGNELAGNLHKKVLGSYTVDKIIPQYEKLYRELLIG